MTRPFMRPTILVLYARYISLVEADPQAQANTILFLLVQYYECKEGLSGIALNSICKSHSISSRYSQRSPMGQRKEVASTLR